MNIRVAAAALALSGLATAASHVAAQDSVGRVVGLRGAVTVDGAGGERRLSCGDMVLEGQMVTTHNGSRAAILTGEVYAQLFVSSKAVFSATPDGTPKITLESGRMRVIDPRDGERLGDVHVRASPAEARFSGNDVDAYVLGPAGSSNALICAGKAPIEVTRNDGGESATAQAGVCAIASLGQPTWTATVPSERIGLADADECDLPVSDAVALRFVPAVAAGRGGPPLPEGFSDPYRDACDDPGSGCAGGPIDQVTPFPNDPLPGGSGASPPAATPPAGGSGQATPPPPGSPTPPPGS